MGSIKYSICILVCKLLISEWVFWDFFLHASPWPPAIHYGIFLTFFIIKGVLKNTRYCYVIFFWKKQLGILSSKPSSQILKQKNSFVFFNFVFEVIKWVMIDNILHSSSSWFAKFDLFRLNSIKNVSIKKTFFGALHYDLLYCIPKIFFRFSNRIYYKNYFM